MVHDNGSPPNSSQELDIPSTTSLGEKQKVRYLPRIFIYSTFSVGRFAEVEVLTFLLEIRAKAEPSQLRAVAPEPLLGLPDPERLRTPCPRAEVTQPSSPDQENRTGKGERPTGETALSPCVPFLPQDLPEMQAREPLGGYGTRRGWVMGVAGLTQDMFRV